MEGGTVIRVGNQGNVNRKSKIYIINYKGSEECGIEQEKESI